jgi:MtN3 and saliva related transmembrane protein
MPRSTIDEPRLRSSWSIASERGPNGRAPSLESAVSDTPALSDTLAILAAGWGLMMAISPAMQIRRILQRRSSDDVSLSYWGVLLVGFALWIAYGISLPNLPLIIPNSVALVVGVITVLVARRYRTPGGATRTMPD